MSLRRPMAVVLVVTSLLIIIGCGKQESDKRLIEIAVRQQRLEGQVSRMGTKIEDIERKLGELLASAQTDAQVSGRGEPAKASQAGAVEDFRDTQEYKEMAATLSALQQQLKAAQNDLAETRAGLAGEMALGKQGNPVRLAGEPFGAMRNPQEIRKRLDALVENFAPKIDDPVLRQEFQGDVEQLKWVNSDNLTTQELYDRLASGLRQRYDIAQDEGTRRWIEHQFPQLESAPGGNLDQTLESIRGTENLTRLGEITQRYGIPAEAMREAGLPSATMNFAVVDDDGDGVAAIAVMSSEGVSSYQDVGEQSHNIMIRRVLPPPKGEIQPQKYPVSEKKHISKAKAIGSGDRTKGTAGPPMRL